MSSTAAVTIGLLLDDPTDPSLAGLVRSAAATAAVHGAVLLTAATAGDVDRERDLAVLLHARGIDGLIVMPAGTDYAYLAERIGAGLVVIFLGGAGHVEGTDTVGVDESGCVRLGVEHLYRHGHRRIAYLSRPPRTPVEPTRLAAYRAAMSALGLTADEIGSGPHVPTALITADSATTLSVLRQRESPSLVRPALVALEDCAFAEVIAPGVTVVIRNLELVGRTAVDRLLERLGGGCGPRLRFEIPATVIPRGSGELPPP